MNNMQYHKVSYSRWTSDGLPTKVNLRDMREWCCEHIHYKKSIFDNNLDDKWWFSDTPNDWIFVFKSKDDMFLFRLVFG